MKAVMYGGGNIGRGFIGMLFSKAGYEVTFIDVVDLVVDSLNAEHKYPVRIVSGETHEDLVVGPVCAINGNDSELAAEVISCADIMATAVGVNVLKLIIPNLVSGIKKRKESGRGPLNIIICENLIDSDKFLAELIKAELNEEETVWFENNIGLVEASIGRMVPVQTEEMKDGNPLRVCVEKYGFLPVDKAAFKGEIPEIKNMIPFEPFDFFIKRKLYLHNMSHATCAYLGLYLGKEYIYEAIDELEIENIVTNAMLESALALSKKYGVSVEELVKHFEDLLNRFENPALGDTCMRVGNDLNRKLSEKDRLVGASKLCLECQIAPVFISIGTAAAIYRYINENNMKQSQTEAKAVLQNVSNLSSGDELETYVLPIYQMFADNANIQQIRHFALKLRQKKIGDVV